MKQELKRVGKLKRIPHIIAGMVILIHSYERYEEEHLSYIYFLYAGLIFLTFAFFHTRIARKFPKADILLYAIEGLLSLLIAYEYFHEGKKYIPFMYVFACLMQFFAIFVFIKKKRHLTRQH